jgi:hypothetical protein
MGTDGTFPGFFGLADWDTSRLSPGSPVRARSNEKEQNLGHPSRGSVGS